MKTIICAVAISDKGEILPYTCMSTKDICEEFCKVSLPGWETMKQLGAKVVQATLAVEEEDKFQQQTNTKVEHLIDEYRGMIT